MAKPQLEDGYTSIANELLEQIVRLHLSPNLWQVLFFIIRKTYGYHKKEDYITNSQIVEGTGIHKSHVSRSIKLLIKKKIITRSGKFIGIQKDWEQWEKLPVLATKVTSIGNKYIEKKLPDTQPKLPDTQPKLPVLATKVTSPRITQKKKETITKETITKDIYILPDFIDVNLWECFLEVRKKQKAVPTDKAKELLIKDLERLRIEGNDPNDVLKQSIKNSWKGLFTLKNNNNGGNGHGVNKIDNRAKMGNRPQQISPKHDLSTYDNL
jgi:phage replication O-like protein O